MNEKYKSQEKYLKEHCKKITLAFILPSEEKLYNHLKEKKNKNGYIKDLIREDIKK